MLLLLSLWCLRLVNRGWTGDDLGRGYLLLGNLDLLLLLWLWHFLLLLAWIKLRWFTLSLTQTINTFQKIVEEGIIKRVAWWWTLMILLMFRMLVSPLSALWQGWGWPVQVILIHHTRVIVIVNHLIIVIESRRWRVLPFSRAFYSISKYLFDGERQRHTTKIWATSEST